MFNYYGIPAERQAWVQSLLDPLAVLVPWWCAEVNVVYVRKVDPTDEEEVPGGGASAQVYPRPAYRDCRLNLYAGFFTLGDQDAEQHLRHELAHLPLYAAWDFAHDAIKRLTDLLVKQGMDEDVAEALRTEYQHLLGQANEASTEDVSRVYARLQQEG